MGMSAGVGKCVGERLSDLGFDRCFAVDRHGGVQPETEDSQVIDTHDVVGVGVCHDSSPDQCGSFAHQLNSQFRTGIDDKFAFRSSDQNAGAHPSIAGVV